MATGQIRQEDVPAEIQRRRVQALRGGLDAEHMLLFVGEVDDERIGWMWAASSVKPACRRASSASSEGRQS